MFGLGAGDRDFQDLTESSNPSLRNRGMRQPANFTPPVSTAIRHVDYFRVARHTPGAFGGGSCRSPHAYWRSKSPGLPTQAGLCLDGIRAA